MSVVEIRAWLDWSDPQHWSDRMRPCRICGTGTHGRDQTGRPCHKSCAEQELAAEARDALGPTERNER